MMDLILWVVGAVVLMTVVYRLFPFREPAENKPKVAFFPKYTVSFSGSSENVASNLKAMGFVADPERPHLYARGKAYGDFSAKSLKLHVSIEEAEKRIKVFAPFLGVFFDTGDLWKIATDAIREG